MATARDRKWLLGTQAPSDFWPQHPPFDAGVVLVLDALQDVSAAWPTFEIRALLRGNAQAQPTDIHYLHLESSFSSSPQPLETQLATPEVVSGRLMADTAAAYLGAWSRGEPVVVGGRQLRLPADRLGPLIPQHVRLNDLPYVRLLDTSYPARSSQVIGWRLYASSHQTLLQEESMLQHSFDLAAYHSGSRSPEFSLHHLGRDITNLSGPGMDVVFPLPLAFEAAVEGEDLVAHLYLRGPLTHDHFWIAASQGPWDLRQQRVRSWSIASDTDGWWKGTSRLAGAAVPPAISVWVGRGDDPEVMAQLVVPPRLAPGGGPESVGLPAAPRHSRGSQ
jgi:hypothetical protein